MKNEKKCTGNIFGKSTFTPHHHPRICSYCLSKLATLFFLGGGGFFFNSYRYLFLECTTLTSIQKQNQNFLCFLSSFLKKKKSLTKTARFSDVAQVKIDSTNIINFPCKVFYC